MRGRRRTASRHRQHLVQHCWAGLIEAVRRIGRAEFQVQYCSSRTWGSAGAARWPAGRYAHSTRGRFAAAWHKISTPILERRSAEERKREKKTWRS